MPASAEADYSDLIAFSFSMGKVLIVRHFVDDHNETEEMLRQFEMNMKYGPCIGMTRLARWERAKNLGMNPPKEIETCLRQAKVGLECLSSSRV
ncbi:hypothetical protein C5167_010240 [Papaver somniferum]|uniref:DNA polymerase delta subunit 4 n=1 Tax=Papaver somniferum TaxID=3469 RepID=A0A4Y7K3K3_PAPSO|nr:hypothetical protein C5167_010240 [Papaver somniferum]